MSSDPITRFEHEKLLLRDTDDQTIEALQKYYGADGTPYFSLIHKGVKFNQYVGVIQVGRKQIEILPKVDRLADEEDTWRGVLIQMLRMTSGIEAEATSSSHLKVLPNSIFNLYIELFIKECERLTHRGLIKRYQKRRENKQALKGRLNIAGQIRENLVHKERFHVEYSAYDQNHLINQILKQTLVVLTHVTPVPSLQNRIKRQLLHFEEIDGFIPTEAAFNSIAYGRKNRHYKKALQIARLILLNYHPDISKGTNDVLALMFDMNDLWEKYIGMQIRRFYSDKYDVKLQSKKDFWKSSTGKLKRLKPDIILRSKQNGEPSIIIDTKWKLPYDMKPSDEDLRQMFAYNRLFGSKKSMLLYPGTNNSLDGTYQTEYGGSCRVQTLQIMNNDGQLLKGEELFESLPNLELIYT